MKISGARAWFGRYQAPEYAPWPPHSRAKNKQVLPRLRKIVRGGGDLLAKKAWKKTAKKGGGRLSGA